MKREIKFRAWNKEDKIMVDLQKITPLALNDMMNTQLNLQGRSGLFIPFFKELELMQYTGLKDKNEKEIYIGDVVQDKYDIKGNPEIDTGRIDFINGCTCVTYFDLDEDEQRQYYPAYNGLKYCEVIGNTTENKELLK